MPPKHMLVLLALAVYPAWAAEKPNVVIIFIDDMGYGDIGPFGSDHLPPRLDRMAEQGMKLTDFYVSSTACTPSRSALLTSCYADRIGMGRSVVFPADEDGLNPKEITHREDSQESGLCHRLLRKMALGRPTRVHSPWLKASTNMRAFPTPTICGSRQIGTQSASTLPCLG